MTPADRQFLAELRTRLAGAKQRLQQIAADPSLDDETACYLDHAHGGVVDAETYVRFALSGASTVFVTLAGATYLQNEGATR